MDFIYSLLAILNGMSPYILLGFLIAGALHVYVKPSLMTRHLAGDGIKPVVKAALLGIPLPLCSCGVLPTAVSLRRNGASNAASTSFLIATPQTGVDSIAATYSLLGPAMAVTRPIAALVCALLGGTAVGRLSPTPTTLTDGDGTLPDSGHVTNRPRWIEAIRYGFVDMIQHVGKWLVIGLIIAALITVFVPDDMFVGLARYPIVAMLVMVAIAVPMYICATGSIPIALSLMIKGLTPGVAFVLMMAGPAANFASVMVLRRSFGGKATAIYIGSVIVVAIAFGLIIDYLLPASWFAPAVGNAACCGGHTFGWFDTSCSVLLVALLIHALVITKLYNRDKIDTQHMTTTYQITGMMCPHCQANVKNGIESLQGVEAVVVDLGKGTAEVVGDVTADTVIARVRSLGYEARAVIA